MHLSAERADHARRERVIETEGVPDGDSLLPNLEARVLRDDDRSEKLAGARTKEGMSCLFPSSA
jgi:hypothetical protein